MDFLLHLFVPLALSLLFSAAHGQSCSGYTFSGNLLFNNCTDLLYLNSSLYWTYDLSANSVSIAFRQGGASPNQWAAWALNPTGTGMAGAQALVAFQQSNGTVAAYTTPISDSIPTMNPGELSFPVVNLSASFVGNDVIIFATLILGNLNGSINQLWQQGPVSGDILLPHNQYGPNLQSIGAVDFQSGGTTNGGGNSNQRLRNIHGVLNAVGWGILIPIGAIIARYMRVFESADPAWYYLHISCQISGYIIGVVGWAIGLHLGSKSGATHATHRAIGIAIFCLATIQLSALLLRPKKDHKHRIFWNIYHHSVGYTIILLSIINIFKGLNILRPGHQWRSAYIAIVVVLALVAAIFEAYTWIVVLRRKKSKPVQTRMGIGMQQTGFNGMVSVTT